MLDISDPQFTTLVEKGVPLHILEQRLQPYSAPKKLEDAFRDYSEEGFIGCNESLLELVHSDWETIERYHTSHEEIAAALKGGGGLNAGYTSRGVSVMTMGSQGCPWGCKGVGGQPWSVIVKNDLTELQELEAIYAGMDMFLIDKTLEILSKTERGEKFKAINAAMKTSREPFYAVLTTLLPHLIREHHFFEGRGTPYRADPEFLIKAYGLGR